MSGQQTRLLMAGVMLFSGLCLTSETPVQAESPQTPASDAAPTEVVPAQNNSGNNSGESKPSAPATADSETPDSETAAQVEAHFKKGRDAIRLKEWETAIEELEAAVKLAPESGALHHALGVAYMGSQQPNAGWFHFRQAVRLAPDYAPAVADFTKTWRLIHAQGVFQVGTPLQLIAQALGKPDQADDQGARLRLIYGYMSLNFMNGQLFSILDLRNLPPEGLHAVDGLAFDLPRSEWKAAYRILSATQGNTEYVPREETLANWTQMFSSQRFINAAATQSAQDIAAKTLEAIRNGGTEIQVETLTDTPDDVLLIWTSPRVEERPAQQEAIRFVRGKQDIHRLAYGRRGETLDRESLTPWLDILKAAQLMTADDLRRHLVQEEERLQENQLRTVSLQILEKQFELIREGDVTAMKTFFAEPVREKITAELLQKTAPLLDQLKPEELVNDVELLPGEDPPKAHLLKKDGEVFTTLTRINGRWYAENIWLETVSAVSPQE